MERAALDDLPGFRRRFRITPGPDSVCCDVEDDFHCMSVLIRHDGEVLLSWVEAQLSILEPDELAGTSLFDMGGWIQSLDPALREAARLLRWGNILASG